LLETERLRLRPPRSDDAYAAAEYLFDEETMAFIGGFDPHVDPSAVVQRWLERWSADGFGPFMVERKSDGVWIGRTGILVWDGRTWETSTLRDAGEHARPELGWTLARRHWGQGYATEAAYAAREWARREHGLERLISLVHPDNVRSARVAEKLGAVPGETIVLEEEYSAIAWVHP
jgi:RimJ/RimL family protein N-acetyltransferase